MSKGKKIGTLDVALDRKIDAYGTRAKFKTDLRFDIQTGMFFASHNSVTYKANTKDDLAKQLKEAVERTIDVRWQRYLVVDYSADVKCWDEDERRPDGYGSSQWGLDSDRADLAGDPDAVRRRDGRQVVTGINLTWHVADYSDPFERPEKPGVPIRMERSVSASRDEDDKVVWHEGTPAENDDDALPPGAVPWTAEREEFLRSVLRALGDLDARMVELFSGAPDDVARRIDEHSFFLALEAPSTPTRNADSITDEEIIWVRSIVGHGRQNAWKRSVRKDCDGALDGSRACREAVAIAWNTLQKEQS